MMKFPNMVYRSPGTHQAPGGTFDYLSVKSEQELEAAAKAGWLPTVEIALEAPKDFDWGQWLGYPDDRPSLERRAMELGIKFDGRTSDERLLERIAEAEAAS